MAIERSRTETTRDFTVYTQGFSVNVVGGKLAGRVVGGGAPFLAMACCEGCRGRWEYGCGRRPRATGEVLILGIG